jgi:hypothetical protein
MLFGAFAWVREGLLSEQGGSKYVDEIHIKSRGLEKDTKIGDCDEVLEKACGS